MELDFRKNPTILSYMVDTMADGVAQGESTQHILIRLNFMNRCAACHERYRFLAP